LLAKYEHTTNTAGDAGKVLIPKVEVRDAVTVEVPEAFQNKFARVDAVVGAISAPSPTLASSEPAFAPSSAFSTPSEAPPELTAMETMETRVDDILQMVRNVQNCTYGRMRYRGPDPIGAPTKEEAIASERYEAQRAIAIKRAEEERAISIKRAEEERAIAKKRAEAARVFAAKRAAIEGIFAEIDIAAGATKVVTVEESRLDKIMKIVLANSHNGLISILARVRARMQSTPKFPSDVMKRAIKQDVLNSTQQKKGTLRLPCLLKFLTLCDQLFELETCKEKLEIAKVKFEKLAKSKLTVKSKSGKTMRDLCDMADEHLTCMNEISARSDELQLVIPNSEVDEFEVKVEELRLRMSRAMVDFQEDSQELM